MSSTTSFYLRPCTYLPESDAARSDLVTVCRDVWSAFDRARIAFSGTGPLFVTVGGGGLVGRLQVALPEDGPEEDECRVPPWMNTLLCGEEWVAVTWCPPGALRTASLLVLRARREADVLALADPAVELAAALMGHTGGPSWSVLTVGQELALDCGMFDVMGLVDTTGSGIQTACILNTDLRVEFAPALDHVRPPTPPPARDADPVLLPEAYELQTPVRNPASRSAFIPFSGKGYRLDGRPVE
jgi:hypothetical protein